MKHAFKYLKIGSLFTALILTACDSLPGNDGDANTKIASESPHCNTISSFSGSTVTITATAEYIRRQITTSGLQGADTPKAIRRAEVAVLNSANEEIQCGTTDNIGGISIVVPQSSETYTLQVRSRAENSYVKASILDKHETSKYYSISQSFTPDSSKDIGTLSAPYSGSLEGGAFNIFDLILRANEYLNSNTSACGSTYANCTHLTVLEKVSVYWSPGFNPLSYYFSNSSDGLSFYLTGTNRLYILGGLNGDVNSSDTDHFDDAIVLHEYGHFIEDNYSRSDSPGGSHSGNSLIDPRLAWSEAFATFLSIQVREGDSFGATAYYDTRGNVDGSTGFTYHYDAELDQNKMSGDDSLDPAPSTTAGFTRITGEGTFREFGIVRALVDLADDASEAGDSLSFGFNKVWAAIASSNGVKSSNNQFINMGTFLYKFTAIDSDDISEIESKEYFDPLLNYQKHYAAPVTTGTCSDFTLVPMNKNDEYTSGGSEELYTSSNPMSSNDFHLFYHSGGSATFTLKNNTGSGDLDLFIYKSGYTYGLTDTRYGFVAGSNENGTGDESVSFSNLSAGYYLINIMYYITSNANAYPTVNYEIQFNGSELCQ